jgi:hypothetical protein
MTGGPYGVHLTMSTRVRKRLEVLAFDGGVNMHGKCGVSGLCWNALMGHVDS